MPSAEFGFTEGRLVAQSLLISVMSVQRFFKREGPAKLLAQSADGWNWEVNCSRKHLQLYRLFGYTLIAQWKLSQRWSWPKQPSFFWHAWHCCPKQKVSRGIFGILLAVSIVFDHFKSLFFLKELQMVMYQVPFIYIVLYVIQIVLNNDQWCTQNSVLL